jgi:hypothetical protein
VGDGNPEVINTRRVRAERRQGMTVIYSVMVSIMILILIQFLLLMVALEEFLAGSRTVLSGAALGSGGCFAAACWMMRYLSQRRTA